MWALKALYWLVIVGVVVVFYRIFSTIRHVRKSIKHLQLEDLKGLLAIEHVVEKYPAEAIKQMHSDFLIAGDAVLAKLSDSVRQSLSAPISDNLRSWFSEGDIPERLTPERVRAARAVVEVADTLERLIQMFRPSRATTSSVVFDEQQNVISIDNSKISIGDVFAKITSKIEIVDDWHGCVATSQIWLAIVALLREGKVRIPGLRAK